MSGMGLKALKAFGIFCLSVICFGLWTLLAGVLASCGDSDNILFSAWLIGVITFGIAMTIAYG